MSRSVRITIVTLLAAIGLWQLGSGLYIHAKAWLAQRLIESSWEQTLAGRREVRPWPWADTWPIARLRIPEADVDLYVLADASGRSLAFGPGYWNGSARPGTAGNTIIAAHRDTHFRFLEHATRGQEILLQTTDGREHRYRLIETRVLDSRHDRIVIEAERPTLTLLTCYPFDAVVPGGPLRYVAIAESAGQLSTSHTRTPPQDDAPLGTTNAISKYF
ncbi:MAG: class GN sortase [Steroidobacter sp.]